MRINLHSGAYRIHLRRSFTFSFTFSKQKNIHGFFKFTKNQIIMVLIKFPEFIFIEIAEKLLKSNFSCQSTPKNYFCSFFIEKTLHQ